MIHMNNNSIQQWDRDQGLILEIDSGSHEHLFREEDSHVLKDLEECCDDLILKNASGNRMQVIGKGILCTELGTALVVRNLNCECSATALFSPCQRKSQRVRRAWTLPQWLGVKEPGSGAHRLMSPPRWGRHPWKLGGCPFELDAVREVGVGPTSWHLYESTTKNLRQGWAECVHPEVAGGLRQGGGVRGSYPSYYCS